MNAILPINTMAPDFSLPYGDENAASGKPTSFQLSDFQNKKNVVLAFYPADFSTVCSSQIALYNELLPEFDQLDAKIVGISVDGVFCHNAFRKYTNLTIDLLSDFHPKAQVSKLYNAYNEDFGTSQRAIYVIDKSGVIQYSYLSPIDKNPGAKEILETLQKLQ